MCETDETFRDSYVHGLCRDGIGAVSPFACRGGGDEGGDGAVWGCVFTGTVPGRFPVDPWWEACEVHGGYLPRYMVGTSRGTWRVPPEVKAASLGGTGPPKSALLNQGDSPCVFMIYCSA